MAVKKIIKQMYDINQILKNEFEYYVVCPDGYVLQYDKSIENEIIKWIVSNKSFGKLGVDYPIQLPDKYIVINSKALYEVYKGRKASEIGDVVIEDNVIYAIVTDGKELIGKILDSNLPEDSISLYKDVIEGKNFILKTLEIEAEEVYSLSLNQIYSLFNNNIEIVGDEYKVILNRCMFQTLKKKTLDSTKIVTRAIKDAELEKSRSFILQTAISAEDFTYYHNFIGFKIPE